MYLLHISEISLRKQIVLAHLSLPPQQINHSGNCCFSHFNIFQLPCKTWASRRRLHCQSFCWYISEDTNNSAWWSEVVLLSLQSWHFRPFKGEESTLALFASEASCWDNRRLLADCSASWLQHRQHFPWLFSLTMLFWALFLKVQPEVYFYNPSGKINLFPVSNPSPAKIG